MNIKNTRNFPYTVGGFVEATDWLKKIGLYDDTVKKAGGDSMFDNGNYIITGANSLWDVLDNQPVLPNDEPKLFRDPNGNGLLSLMKDKMCIGVTENQMVVSTPNEDGWDLKYFPLDEEKRRELINILQVPPSLPQDSRNCVIIS